MADQMKTYRGNCHCGTYVYEVKAAENLKVSECNCSSCYKKNILYVAYKTPDLQFVKGDPSTLADYTFGMKRFHYKFCPRCGNQLLIEGYLEPPNAGETKEPVRAVNSRTFQHGQGLDVWKVEKNFINGKSFGAPYEPYKITGPEPEGVVEGGKLYTGSCHCGAVRVAFKAKPLDKTSTETLMECNCSICQRQGSVWVYPKKAEAVIEGEENLETYLFGTMLFGKAFCRICGVPVVNTVQPMTEEVFNQLPKGHQDFATRDVTAINLRLIDELDVKDLNVVQFDGYNFSKPPYVEP
ncbi:glutathione-dependent formaldehyde-activating enzyme [Hypoxylon cercidicola]|nr:glutathione-dependent formaldehyde-activating enzyme [Hypoxylon cercidicola]